MSLKSAIRKTTKAAWKQTAGMRTTFTYQEMEDVPYDLATSSGGRRIKKLWPGTQGLFTNYTEQDRKDGSGIGPKDERCTLLAESIQFQPKPKDVLDRGSLGLWEIVNFKNPAQTLWILQIRLP